MREERQITQKEKFPKKEVSVQNITKTKVVPLVLKEETHTAQKQVFKKLKQRLKILKKFNIFPYSKKRNNI